MKKNRKGIVIGLTLLYFVGITLLFIPLFIDSYVTTEITRKEIVFHNELPLTIPEPEIIREPRLEDLLQRRGTTEILSNGFVLIEEIDFVQPLLIGITNENLVNGGAVAFPERDLDSDNMVLLGHHLSYRDGLFGPLTKAKKGMVVTVFFKEKIAEYVITSVQTIDETDVSVMDQTNDPILTMLTYPVPYDSPKRLLIRAEPLQILDSGTIPITMQEKISSITEQTNFMLRSKASLVLCFYLLLLLIGMYFIRKAVKNL